MAFKILYCEPNLKLFFHYLDGSFCVFLLDNTRHNERSNDELSCRNHICFFVTQITVLRVLACFDP
jgi:hypothetical protein